MASPADAGINFKSTIDRPLNVYYCVAISGSEPIKLGINELFILSGGFPSPSLTRIE